MAIVLPGQREWKGTRGDDGQYTFTVTHRVRCEPGEGPHAALTAEGLPQPGDQWKFNVDVTTGVAAEQLLWAWCGQAADAEPVVGEGESEYWDITQVFKGSSDPLTQPPQISITFSRTSEEATRDRFGRPLTNSAWELLQGKQVEFDGGMIVVSVLQNVPDTPQTLAQLAAAYQTVNGKPLWGLGRRTIKLSNASLKKHNYYIPDPTTGVPVLSKYYERALEFEVNFTGWDRRIRDQSNKVLRGEWRAALGTESGVGEEGTNGKWEWVLTPDPAGNMPNPYNPKDFIRFVDTNGNATKGMLNGAGIPAGSIAPTGDSYLSIKNGNIGNPLTDGSSWIPTPTPAAFESWYNDQPYVRGDLVYFDTDGKNYAALLPSTGIAPNTSVAPLPKPKWLELPGSTTHEGLYDVNTSYNLGNVVADSTVTTAGILTIQKYHESDFVLLGIPETL